MERAPEGLRTLSEPELDTEEIPRDSKRSHQMSSTRRNRQEQQVAGLSAGGGSTAECLHQLFEARADAQPETICVIDAGSGGRWTYAEVRISSPRQPALRALLASDGFHSASKKNGLFSPALSLRDNWGDIHLKASHASRPASAGAEPPALRRRARAPRQYRLPLAP